VLAVLAGCASFPQAGSSARFDDGLSAQQVFDQCLAAHGGDIGEYPGDFNISTDGYWYALIQRIQPIVSDAGFRVTAQERYRPRDGLYAVRHDGPLGTKQVVGTPAGISVYYNGQPETDPVKLRATAMTNDAFQMFHFGPSFFRHRAIAPSHGSACPTRAKRAAAIAACWQHCSPVSARRRATRRCCGSMRILHACFAST